MSNYIKIDLKHYIEREVKHLDEKINVVFGQHDRAIKRARKIVECQSEKVETKLTRLERIVYIGVGICIALELIFKFLIK